MHDTLSPSPLTLASSKSNIFTITALRSTNGHDAKRSDEDGAHGPLYYDRH